MIRVLLADDQAMIRAGLRSVLDSAGIEVVGEAPDGGAAVRTAASLRPDVVLMDLRMPGTDGVEATRLLRRDPALAQVRILVLTTFDSDRDVVEALAAGADGFLGKSAEPDDLIDAVRRTAAGESALSPRASRAVVTHLAAAPAAPTGSSGVDHELMRRVATLTPREKDMVAAAAAGADNATIARDLTLSPHTVKTHINRAMTKLGARDRGQLVAIAYRTGIAPGRSAWT